MGTFEKVKLPKHSYSRGVGSSIVAGHLVLTGLILTAPLVTIEPGSMVLRLTCGAFIFFTAWLLWSWRRLTGTCIDPYTLFLIAAVAFNDGQFILEALHLNEFGILDERFPEATIFKSLYLTASGLAALHLGAMIAWLRWGRLEHQRARSASTLLSIRMVGWCLIGVSIVPAILVINRDVGRVVASGYSTLYNLTPVVGYDRTEDELARFLIPGVLFLIAGARRDSLATRVSVSLMAVSSLKGLFLGGRAGALTGAVGYIWLFHRFIRRIPRVAMIVSVTLIVVILPTIGAIRDTTGEQRTSVVLFFNTLISQANPVVSVIHEMGNSVRAIASTIQLVPDIRPFELGDTYLWATTTVFPNLFWAVHPGAVHTHLAQWLVQTVEPTTAAKGGGLGFSFIAEAYLNFGWLGTPLVLLVIGYLWGGLVVRVRASNDPLKMAMVAAMLAPILNFSRGEFSDCIRGLAWYGILPVALALAANVLCRRRSRTKGGASLDWASPRRPASPRRWPKNLQRVPPVGVLPKCS
jgi:oligosaccharide repeat unit polymerase